MTEAITQTTPISALRELVDWSEENLPVWQRDALRRLYQQGCDLSNDDLDELLLLCKKPHNLLAPDERCLCSLGSLERVNALAGKQTLTFEPAGLTIVFGNNATGKSGYARILKKACRARSDEDVLPNVYEDSVDDPASGKITYNVGVSSPPPHTWSDGQPEPRRTLCN